MTAHRLTRSSPPALTPTCPRLALTAERWGAEIDALLQLDVTNTEGYNRVITQVKRVACGFRNQPDYERRTMMHTAAATAT